MILIAILIALASAFATYSPPYTIEPTDDKLYVQYRQHKAEAKKKEAQRIAKASLPTQSIEEIDTPILSNSPVINQINQYRQSLGLNALTEDPSLNASAQTQASQLTQSNWWIHSRNHEIQGGRYGHSDPDSSQVQGWINSPPHHSIMTGAYTHIGCHKSFDGSWYWYACHFS